MDDLRCCQPVAAALCGLPWGSWPSRFAGFALIAPAAFVMDAGAGSNGYRATAIAAGAAIVIVGGALAAVSRAGSCVAAGGKRWTLGDDGGRLRDVRQVGIVRMS